MSNFGQLQLHEGYLRVTRWIGGSLISTFAVRTLQEFCAMLNQRASETMKGKVFFGDVFPCQTEFDSICNGLLVHPRSESMLIRL